MIFKPKAQYWPSVIMRLPVVPDEARIRRLVLTCTTGKSGIFGGLPAADIDDQLVAGWRDGKTFGVHYNSRFLGLWTTISYAFLGGKDYTDLEGRVTPTPILMESQYQWATIDANPQQIDCMVDEQARWFLDRCRCPIETLTPEFAVSDTGDFLRQHLKHDPSAFAWPLMVLGPERVAKLGRERVLKSPAWKVEELAYGGVWIQVSPNPYSAPRKSLEALATYLGLLAP